MSFMSQMDNLVNLSDVTVDINDKLSRVVGPSSVVVSTDSNDSYFSSMLFETRSQSGLLKNIDSNIAKSSGSTIQFQKMILDKIGLTSGGIEGLADKFQTYSDNVSLAITDSQNKLVEEFEKSQEESNKATTDSISKSISGLSKTITVALANVTTKILTRANNEYKSMYESRNALMYEYGVSAQEADEIYKAQFQTGTGIKKWQKRTAAETRAMSVNANKALINAGYYNSSDLSAMTNLLAKWEDQLPGVANASDQLFKTVYKGFDNSAAMLDEVMVRVQKDASALMVTPELLSDVTNGYAKYMKSITNTNSAFTSSMNGVIDTVARLEDAQIDATQISNDVLAFNYATLSDAASQDMWTRLVMAGIDPTQFRSLNADEQMNTYVTGMRDFFSSKGYTGESLRENGLTEDFRYLAQTMGYSGSNLQDLIDILEGDIKSPEEVQAAINGSKTDVQILDKITEQAYTTEELLKNWSYVTENEKLQNTLTRVILDNKVLGGIYDGIQKLSFGLLGLHSLSGIATRMFTGRVANNATSTIVANIMKGKHGVLPTAGDGFREIPLTTNGEGNLLGTVEDMSSSKSALKGGKLGVLASLAGGYMMFNDARSGVQMLSEELGSDASLNMKISQGIGSALGGNSSGLYGGVSNAMKGALVGSIAGPIGTVIGGVAGLTLGAIGGDKLADFLSGGAISEAKRQKALNELNESTKELYNQLANSSEIVKESAQDVVDAFGSEGQTETESYYEKNMTDSQMSMLTSSGANLGVSTNEAGVAMASVSYDENSEVAELAKAKFMEQGLTEAEALSATNVALQQAGAQQTNLINNGLAWDSEQLANYITNKDTMSQDTSQYISNIGYDELTNRAPVPDALKPFVVSWEEGKDGVEVPVISSDIYSAISNKSGYAYRYDAVNGNWVDTGASLINTAHRYPVEGDKNKVIDVNSLGDEFYAHKFTAGKNESIAYFESGIPNIPYDDYPALLHRGERVLTANENQLYSQYLARLADDSSGTTLTRVSTDIVNVINRLIDVVKEGFSEVKGESSNTEIRTRVDNKINSYSY